MPQHKSMWKRMRTSAKERARNREVRSEVRQSMRQFREATPDDMVKLLPATSATIDNAVRKGVVKQGTGDRLKSRLAKLANRSQASA